MPRIVLRSWFFLSPLPIIEDHYDLMKKIPYHKANLKVKVKPRTFLFLFLVSWVFWIILSSKSISEHKIPRMGNALRLICGYCCKPTSDSDSLGHHGVTPQTVGVSALAHDLYTFEITSQVRSLSDQSLLSSSIASIHKLSTFDPSGKVKSFQYRSVDDIHFLQHIYMIVGFMN